MSGTPFPLHSVLRRVLERRETFTIGAQVCTGLAAATTIAAPAILQPTEFVKFTLAMVIFQYFYDFDLGLTRLADRRMTAGGTRQDESNLTVARLVLAAAILIVLVACLPLLGATYVIAGMAAICFMLASGPVTFYRARSHYNAFTVMALTLGSGMILPRLLGLLIGGVSGCVTALLIFYAGLAVAYNVPFIRATKELPAFKTLFRYYRSALPLFAFANMWTLYLLTPRWFSAVLADATNAGLFAFGANLVSIGAGSVSSATQVFYPKHLKGQDTRPLMYELLVLLSVAFIGILLACVGCRYGLASIFPKFAAAAPSMAAMVASGISISLTAWMMPVLIATSLAAWSETLLILGGSTVGLMVLMWLGEFVGGIIGQAWACNISGLLLLLVTLLLMVRRGKLPNGAPVVIGVPAILLTGFLAVVWGLLFD